LFLGKNGEVWMRPVRTIHEIFTEKEFEELKAVKGNKTWHDFIMELAKHEEM
jgi:hypothetical protein